MRNPVSFLHESLFFGTVANLLLTAIGLHLIIGPVHAAGWNPWVTAPVVFGLGLFAIEILPKTAATRTPARALQITLPLLMVIRKFFHPFQVSLTRSAETVVKWMTPKRLKPRVALAAEEIETLIEMHQESGAITTEDATVMQEIVNLHGQTARDCMTPRVDLPLMPHDTDDENAARMLQGARFRHVAVFDERADAITALVDTEAWRLAGQPAWKVIARQPVFVPETMPALDVLRRHLPDAAAAVVIVDEYGGFEGMMTRRNLAERLLRKAAPLSNADGPVLPLGPGRWLVNGAARVDEVNQELDLSLDAGGIDTIGGLIFNHLGYLPRPGERVEFEGLRIKIKRTARNRILQMELRLAAAPEEKSA